MNRRGAAQCVKWSLTALLVVCVTFVSVAGCWRRKPPLPTPPDLPIVFQAFIGNYELTADGYPLGFAGTAGQDIQRYVIPFDRCMDPAVPVVTSDGALVIAVSLHGHCGLRAIDSSGKLVIYPDRPGSPFAGAWRVAPVVDSHQLVAVGQDGWDEHNNPILTVLLLDLDARKAVRTYVRFEPVAGEPPAVPSLSIGTNPLSGPLLTYSRCRGLECELVVHDTITTDEYVLVRAHDGILESPAFSPDGRWIAYTTSEGIDVIASDRYTASMPRRIVEMSLDEQWYQERIILIPAASWSPDDAWLAYHRCMRDCREARFTVRNFSIFKVNVDTGEEVLLVKEGLHPYWRH